MTVIDEHGADERVDDLPPLSDTLPEHEPDPLRTLGWGVILWAHTWLIQPDGDNAGEPWRFTDAQVHFLLWYYAIDENGRWLHHRAAIRRSKGTGKSPMVAALALAEFIGPVRFAGWDSVDDSAGFEFLVGKPVAMPWVQIAATAESQTVNTMAMVLGMAPPGSRARGAYALDCGKTRIFTPAGGRLEIITASPHAAEGARCTFAIEDETEWWTESNGGKSLDSTIRRNLAKMSGRLVETCNAFVPGAGSVAEDTYNVHVMQVEGRTRSRGLLYDSLEAPADTDPEDDASLRRGLARAYSCAPWVDLEAIIAQYRDPGVDPNMAARFYLNQLTSGEDAWIDPREWKACGLASRRERAEDADVGILRKLDDLAVRVRGVERPRPVPAPLADGDLVVLGFDGSVREDATALVASRVSDGHLALLGVWEKPPNATKEWQVDRVAVDATLHQAMIRFDVAGFYADPAHWQDYVDRWHAEYAADMRVRATNARPLEYWTGGGNTRRMVLALERFREAVADRSLSHQDDPTLDRHVGNAVERVTRSGTIIGKEYPTSLRKIDACMAAVVANEARNDAVAAGLADALDYRPIRVY